VEGLPGDALVINQWPTVARWFQRCRRCWWQLLLCFFLFLSPCFSLLSSSSGLLFFGLITLSLCSLSLLFSSVLSYVFSAPLSLVLSPVFIGKTGGREVGGGHCAAASKTARGTHLLPLLLQHVESFGQVGLVDVFLRESWRWKTEEEKKIFLFPCFARLGEEEDI
jgi:hypothetical protein